MPSPSQRFEPDYRSAGAARRFVSQVLAAWGLSAVETDVNTIVSELATNAVLHAQTPFTVTLELEEPVLRLAVSDGSASLPRPRRFGGPDSATGRGLHMVAALSQTWGVTPGPGGKTTWCEVLLTPAPAPRQLDGVPTGAAGVDTLLARPEAR